MLKPLALFPSKVIVVRLSIVEFLRRAGEEVLGLEAAEDEVETKR